MLGGGGADDFDVRDAHLAWVRVDGEVGLG